MQEHEAASDDEKLPERHTHGRAAWESTSNKNTERSAGSVGYRTTVCLVRCVLNHVAPQRKLQQE